MKSLIRTIAYIGIGSALVCAGTMVIQIPVPQTKGYINLGDALVLTIAMLFGAKIGGLAGGIGSALADIILGYTHWAPFTFVIKGIEGIIAGTLAYKAQKMPLRILFLILAGLEMVTGYFITEIFLYGIGPALAELPGNLFQAGGGVLISTALVLAIKRAVKDNKVWNL
ncbi:ECF transporter S component [bacterium]|nr:ECF transporter S component [bacterium]